MNAIQKAVAAFATEHDPRWSAVVARDAAADGRFWYSVSTTGVYCRPSCAARLARPEHVRFHSTRQAAEHAGFRPCKRCKPDRMDRNDAQTRTPIRFGPRAVAAACAANPLAVAISWHRVVRSDGGLSGYRWGVERKGALLARETRA